MAARLLGPNQLLWQNRPDPPTQRPIWGTRLIAVIVLNPNADGTGLGTGTAVPLTTRIRTASGAGLGGGSTASLAVRPRTASGTGTGTGTATGLRGKVASASGSGLGGSTAVGLRTQLRTASGAGAGSGTAVGVLVAGAIKRTASGVGISGEFATVLFTPSYASTLTTADVSFARPKPKETTLRETKFIPKFRLSPPSIRP